MANWDKIDSRGNVEDRRSFRPAAIGGISLAGVALFFLVNYLNGGSFEEGLQQLGNTVLQEESQTSQRVNTDEFSGDDPYQSFISAVLGSNNVNWDNKFKNIGQTYIPPRLVLFRVATESACGTATSSVGPHYCSLDSTIYLDETFFDEMSARFGAKGGDVAQAYVVSHEVGHHVQKLNGNLDNPTQDNLTSIKIELQADCYAGIWANSIKDQGVFEQGEIREAMDAAASVGDDNIQEKVQGYVNPETFTHGTSEQRLTWFTKGYESGNPNSCGAFEK